MTLTRTAQKTLISAFAAVLLILYVHELRNPNIGLWRDDALNLLLARTLGEPTQISLFPVLLAPFARLSTQSWLLKLIPLFCTAGWLGLTYRLLRRMGASNAGALILIALTTAAPSTIHIATTLLPESLFGLLIAATLLCLLSDKAIAAGCLAALATITQPAGAAVILACIFTFLARRRFRSAVRFSLAAMLIAAPWCGWTLAHLPPDSPLARAVTLRASEESMVIGLNLLYLLAAPFELLTGIYSLYAASTTAFVLAWALIRRRQFVPDVFLLFYAIAIICWPSPPQAAIAPVLPLILWLLWRAFHNMRIAEALAAMILILVSLSLWADIGRIRHPPENDWSQMQRIFGWLRSQTSPGDVLMADLDPLVALNTGRTTVRGFKPDMYSLIYAPSGRGVSPDQLTAAINSAGVAYVVVTPDRNLREAASYHRAVEALERGGAVEPIAVPGLNRDYRILRTHRGY